MNLRIKFNLILILVFSLGLIPAGWISHSVLQRNARSQVIQNARIMMETAMAMRGYTVKQVKPLLAPMLEETFLPQSVPAYAATEIFNALRGEHPEYTYKEATLNPTNPRNRTVDWEADLVNVFRNHPDRKEIIGERDTPTGRSLYLSHPIRVTDPGCLSCHTTPDQAPPSQVRLYGSAGGFGWKLDEVIGAQVVSVPMALPVQMADRGFRTILLSLLAVFAITMVLFNLLLEIVVIRPLRRLSHVADRVSVGDMDVPDVPVRGRDEVAALAGSFNRMRISLVKALGMLEDE